MIYLSWRWEAPRPIEINRDPVGLVYHMKWSMAFRMISQPARWGLFIGERFDKRKAQSVI